MPCYKLYVMSHMRDDNNEKGETLVWYLEQVGNGN